AFNFIHLSRMPEKGFLEKLKTISGPVILWEPGKDEPMECTRGLLRKMKSAGVSAAIIPGMEYQQAETEDFLLQLTA
ncbi:hypothetical protein, partial [Klebsiella pneumoniae]|uniref:hypothetical protein n=1 Tax=Klebsiella pneumoniae TaxID=573 RepID=UPI0027308655